MTVVYQINHIGWSFNCRNFSDEYTKLSPDEFQRFFDEVYNDFINNNRGDCDYCDTIATFDTLEEAEQKLKDYVCIYEQRDNYNLVCFEIYELEKIYIDDDGDINGGEVVKRARAEW